jgi:hypothetical protein
MRFDPVRWSLYLFLTASARVFVFSSPLTQQRAELPLTIVLNASIVHCQRQKRKCFFLLGQAKDEYRVLGSPMHGSKTPAYAGETP